MPRPSADRRELLARLLAQKGVRVSGDVAIPRQPDGTPPVPSFAQQRLWFVQHLDPTSTAYHLTQAIRLRGPLDVGALDRALVAIAARHDALRMAFPDADGDGTVVVFAAPSTVLDVVDLGKVPDRERQARLDALERDTFEEPFDLATGPLWRARLATLDADDHLLLLCAHHIAVDGWSLGLFMNELTALYAEAAAGHPAALPAVPLRYTDYAAWQRGRAEQGTWEADLAYWVQRLADVPALALPTDRPRAATPSQTGALRRFTLPADLVADLRDLARQEDATPFMVLMAGFQALLFRQTGQTDFAVGTPVANRDRPEIEQAIGLFANMLALRADLSGTPTFRELVRRTRQTANEAFGHQEPPFEQIVERLQPARTLSRHLIFQVALTLQNTPPARWDIPGVSLEVQPPAASGAKFELTVALEERHGGFDGTAEYRADLFDAATIDRLTARFALLLRAAIREPDRPLVDLPILTLDEREHLQRALRRFHAPAAPATLHERFEAQARRTPEAVAVTCDGRELTYAALDAAANRLASRLAAAGVGAETLVPLFLDRTSALVVAVLGVLKAGGAYVPIDPAYPAERIAFVLRDCGASIVLTEQALRDRLPDAAVDVRCLDEWLAASDDEPDGAARSARVDPAQAAYVIYTSGSTGQPKGVIVSHANACRLFDATQDRFGFGASDVWALFHSYAFDFSVWEIWGALLFGGRLVVVPYWVSRSVDQFHRLLVDERVTVLNQTPSAFRQLVAHDAALEVPVRLSLRYVIFGGEALDLQALAPWFARHGDHQPRLVNMYGITETTVHVTFRPIDERDLTSGAGSVIGEPIGDLHVLLLDDRFNPVPTGATGEIFVGGPGVARGYLGRPDLTGARFVPDPFGPPGTVLYRSGDLARRRSDGDLEYLGRADHQVKIRGFRIELGEIESRLTRHPDIAEAVVVSRHDDGDRDARLVAYIVPRDNASPAAAELRAFVQAALPDYMTPAAFVTLAELPLTPHGKVDRRALPAPDASRTVTADYEPPATAAERDLAGAWAEGLGLERVGVTDNFFALGGDSIRSIRVRTLARARGYDFSLPDLFQYQTVRELAHRVVQTDAAPTDERTAGAFSLIADADRAALPDDVEDAFPVAALQAGMLFHAELDPGSGVYHDVFSFHLRAAWDEAALAESAADLAARHAVLRTSLHEGGYSEPLQLVHREARVPLEVEDLRGLSDAAQEAHLDAWLAAERQRPFDWMAPPLLRLHVHQRTDETFQFGLTVHHSILDGWSLSSLLTELFGRYLDRLAGQPAASIVPPAGSYRQFVAMERAALADPDTARFWEERLADLQVPALPARREPATPPGSPRRMVVRRLAWDQHVTGHLQRIATETGASLKSVLLAAHLRVLASLAAQADLVTGLISNGRPEEPGAEEVLGLFLNTVPLRVAVAGGSWRSLIQSAFEAERALLPHRRYPLAQIQRQWGRRELIETAFNFVHFHVFAPLVGRDDFRLLGSRHHEETNFRLFAQFAVDPATGGLSLGITYDLGMFSEDQADEITAYYRRALDALAADPDGRYEAVALLSPAEDTRLLDMFNRTALAHDTSRCLHDLVEAAAGRQPDATAIIDGDRRVSYGELQRRTNRWARELQRLGVAPDVRVGVSLGRSADLVAVLLAVLKAGGAYVPLDPAYPVARLESMAADAAPALIITSRTLRDGRPPASVPTVLLEDLQALPASHASKDDDPAPRGGVSPDNLAYLIYTSGSTGRPKAAAIQHRNAVALADWADSAFDAAAFAGVLASTSVSFDLSVFEIFVTLARGGTIVLADHALALPDLPAAGAVTLVNTVPSAIAELLRQRAIPTSVRTVLLAGEPLSASLVDALYGLDHVSAVYDLYGPSEDTTYSTFGRREPGGPETIGRPVANTRVYLLDQWLQPVPLGTAGILYIGGQGLARGYWDRPGLTADRFVPDPFAVSPGSRMYCTGDLARFMADGRLIFLGRVDQQVKVRGFRIEPGEIVAALERHEAVAEAAVVAREDESGRRRLVAYVAPRTGAAIDVERLREALAAQLPDYMLPAGWVTLAALPRTPNGKLDRRALPAPDDATRAGTMAYEAPQPGVEEILARIWADVLRVSRVGRHDNFFFLGGDSILLLQILSRARAAGLQCSAQQVLRTQTVARLAEVVQTAAEPHVANAPAAGPVNLTPIQRWFFAQDLAEPHHWNQSLLLETRQPLDPARLEAAVAALVRHHEALRLRFDRDGDVWRARIGPPEAADWHVRRIALRALDGSELAAAIGEACAEDQAGLNLSRGPLVRVTSFDLGPDRPGRLFLVVHHLAVDGVSWRILLEDLLTLYDQGSDATRLPARTASIAAWATALARHADGPALEAERSYWLALAEGPMTALPLDSSGEPVANVAGASDLVSVALTSELTTRLLREVPARRRARINDLLLTALGEALACWTGARDHLVHLEGHGREPIDEAVDVSRTVGWFTSLFPFRLSLPDTDNPLAALAAVKALLRALPGHGLGYGILRYLGRDEALRRRLASAPAPQISFNYLGQFDQALGAGGPFAPAREPSGSPYGPRNRRAHLIDVNSVIVGDCLHIDMHYGRGVHRRETIERLAGGYVAALERLVRAALAAPPAGPTPDEFALADVSQRELDAALEEIDL